jgi:hypothetical protein
MNHLQPRRIQYWAESRPSGKRKDKRKKEVSEGPPDKRKPIKNRNKAHITQGTKKGKTSASHIADAVVKICVQVYKLII